MFFYTITIFIGAFLLFQVQPVIARYILPWFGGTTAVWTTSVLFFQTFLLAGYAYAYVSIRWIRPNVQIILHRTLLLAALFQLPVIPDNESIHFSVGNPTLDVLILLIKTVGLPFLVLSSTAPLIQAWFSNKNPGRKPYRRYAISNLGSLLALLSYPFLVEPYLGRKMQAEVWSITFLIYVITCSICTIRGRTHYVADCGISVQYCKGRNAPPTQGDRILWLLLSACASILLLAVTNQICHYVSAVPLLWLLPLIIYLLSFIITFNHERWYVRNAYAAALPISLCVCVWIMYNDKDVNVIPQLIIYSAILYICCMVCHGEINKIKPHPDYLTGFYLLIALGGTLGGIFVTVIAPPLIFVDYLELSFGLISIYVLVCIVFYRDKNWILYKGRPRWAWYQC
ncbi:MAG: hypothetical protein GY941_11695 [Planctomycetes bacterium]|nr:hypothetical protein [Planctomycetota bacterium]